MATKTITITEDAYNSIVSFKDEKESFSHFFLRLSKERGVASKYLGILSGAITDTRKRFKENRNRYHQDYEDRSREFFRHKRSS